jgi:hypothetical protein
LIKKIDELSTLCEVDACAIIYSENASEPDVWPPDEGVERVLAKFRGMNELDQSQKKFDQKSYLKQRIKKVEKQLKKHMKGNKEKEMTNLMHQCVNAGRIPESVNNVDDLNNLTKIIDQHLKQIDRRIKHLSRNQEGTSIEDVDHLQGHGD